MSGGNNPYGGFTGGQFSASANLSSPAPSTPAAPSASGLIKDTTTAQFSRDVLEESRQQPVLVDFWAPWCGPCKQLAPVLEKVVNEAAGRVKLIKLNIDDHPAIPGQLGIQSIPAVIAFVDGRPADGFMGNVPESQIREFIDRIAGPAPASIGAQVDALLAEAETLLDHGDPQGAASLYAAVLQADPENAKAATGLAQCMIAVGQPDQARQFIASLPESVTTSAAFQPLLKQLQQLDEARKLGDPAALERELDANPDSHETRIKLAKILNAQGNRDEAADHLLHVMRQDRSFGDEAAKKQLLEFFDVWGFKDPATISARRKLSSLLFS